MSDEVETRIEATYGHLAPDEGLREGLLGSLSAERASPNAWRKPMTIVMTVVVLAALMVVTWPDGTDVPPVPPSIQFWTDGDVVAVAEIMRMRLAVLGVSGAEVRIGKRPGELAVHLPPDVAALSIESALLRPGTLELRIVIEEPKAGAGRRVERTGGDPPLTVREPVDSAERFGGEDLDREKVLVRPDSNSTGWLVHFAILEARKAEFEAFTRENVKKRLAILIDGRIEMAPVIRSPLPGEGIIIGGGSDGFTRGEADSLAAILISGAYPAEVRPR